MADNFNLLTTQDNDEAAGKSQTMRTCRRHRSARSRRALTRSLRPLPKTPPACKARSRPISPGNPTSIPPYRTQSGYRCRHTRGGRVRITLTSLSCSPRSASRAGFFIASCSVMSSDCSPARQGSTPRRQRYFRRERGLSRSDSSLYRPKISGNLSHREADNGGPATPGIR